MASSLLKGDKICVGGGIRKASKNYPRILNLEFIDIIELKKNMIKSNPICKKCNKKMKSKGNNQGYQCIKCGKKSEKKITLEIPRNIKKQMYIPNVSAHRHLSRPLQRIGRINKESRFDESISWFCIYEN
jgi:tRNA(Ile2)-agmatinylcytidine synthase